MISSRPGAGALETLIDADLLAHAEIWAAAGRPNTVFRLTPDQLMRMTGGRGRTLRLPRR